MIRYENDCVCCDIPCIKCGREQTPHYYCDRCRCEETLYYYGGEELCKDCIFDDLEVVEGSD